MDTKSFMDRLRTELSTATMAAVMKLLQQYKWVGWVAGRSHEAAAAVQVCGVAGRS